MQKVVAAVIERDSHFLLGKRSSERRYGGLWEFPGGKALPHESVADAIIREVREDLGVEVSSASEVIFSCEDPGSDFIIEFCRVVVIGEPKALEHQALKWVAVGGLLALDLAPTDRAFCNWISGLSD
jgi:8-oxo-dGTP diphosphatase